MGEGGHVGVDLKNVLHGIEWNVQIGTESLSLPLPILMGVELWSV